MWAGLILPEAEETLPQASSLAPGGQVAIFGAPWFIEASTHLCLYQSRGVHMASP